MDQGPLAPGVDPRDSRVRVDPDTTGSGNGPESAFDMSLGM